MLAARPKKVAARKGLAAVAECVDSVSYGKSDQVTTTALTPDTSVSRPSSKNGIF